MSSIPVHTYRSERKDFKVEHWLDGTIVLFYDIVEIIDLPDWSLPIMIDSIDGYFVGLTFIHRD
jgi:hypothetical protein